MNVHIVSDGNPYNTKITDDNGEPIKGVVKATWEISMEGSKLTLEFENFGYNITIDKPCCIKLRKFFKVIYANPTFVAHYLNKGYKVCK